MRHQGASGQGIQKSNARPNYWFIAITIIIIIITMIPYDNDDDDGADYDW